MRLCTASGNVCYYSSENIVSSVVFTLITLTIIFQKVEEKEILHPSLHSSSDVIHMHILSVSTLTNKIFSRLNQILGTAMFDSLFSVVMRFNCKDVSK